MKLRFVERDAELKVIEESFSAVRAGRGGVLVLSGPVGIGKSRLVAIALDRAASAGVCATRTRTSAAGSGGFSFAAAIELLEPLVAAGGKEVFEGSAMSAAALFRPSLGNDEPGLDGRAVHGLYRSVANITAARPHVFVVDDLQWVDDASLAFLHHLAQRIDQVPVLLIATLRTDTPTPSPGRLPSLLSLRGVRTMALAPLTGDGVAQVVRSEYRAEATASLCAEVHAATGGNPFLLHELLGAVIAGGSGSDVEVLRAASPDGVRRLATARLLRVGDDAASLARALAVLGEADLPAVARVAGLDGASGLAAVGVLVESGITTNDGTLRFVHPLIGRAIDAELGHSARLALHADAAAILVERGADPEVVAAHLLGGAPIREDWAIGQLGEAARRAMQHGAPEVAASYLRRAVEETSSAEQLGDVLMALGGAEAAVGDDRAVADFHRARTLSGDPLRRAHAEYRIALAHRAAGRLDDARDAFDVGIAECHDTNDPLYLRLLAGRATTVEVGSVSQRAIDDLRRAAGDGPANAVRLATAAAAAVRAGAPRDEPIALSMAALEGELLADEGAGSPAFQAALEVLLWSGGDAHRFVHAGVVAARTSGSAFDQATMHYRRAVLRWQTGELRGAIADARAALAFVPAGWGLHAPAARALLARALLETGAVEAARDVLTEVMVDQRRAHTLADAWLLEAAASLELVDGDPLHAASLFERIGHVLEGDLQIFNPAILPWRSEAAHAYVLGGERTRAAELAAAELDAATRFGWTRPIGIAEHALGCAEEGVAEIAHLEASIHLLEQASARVEEASARVDLGSALLGAGRVQAAVEQLQAAVAIALSCGATGVARRAQTERRAARGHVARGRRGSLALTPGEDRVVNLVVAGLTNRQAAERLFVSVKAVEWHLGNAYRKLGVATRAELRDLVGAPRQETGAAS